MVHVQILLFLCPAEMCSVCSASGHHRSLLALHLACRQLDYQAFCSSSSSAFHLWTLICALSTLTLTLEHSQIWTVAFSSFSSSPSLGRHSHAPSSLLPALPWQSDFRIESKSIFCHIQHIKCWQLMHSKVYYQNQHFIYHMFLFPNANISTNYSD